jgi:hypothetical protein
MVYVKIKLLNGAKNFLKEVTKLNLTVDLDV